MKRVEIIRAQLCNILENFDADEFEQVLYDLRNTELFSKCIINILESFDRELFRGVSDQEMSEMVSSGMYSEEFTEWLNEKV